MTDRSTSNNEWLKTHYYDGKMVGVIGPHRLVLNNIRSLGQSDKIKMLRELWSHIVDRVPNSPYLSAAFTYFNSILNSIGTPTNYDAVNDLYAEDLLYMCIPFVSSIDFCYSLVEQLHDISRGPCSQGKCTRILQLIVSYSTSSSIEEVRL